MITTTDRHSSTIGTIPVGLWNELFLLVNAYEPDVVVLVARKMPRLAEFIGADFKHAIVITDLATTCSHAHLHGARVAVIDDVVNVGSTLQQAADAALACGAADVQLFALGRR